MGVTPGSHVGVRLWRAPEMIVAILGILKAGGAYVPLGPNDPPDRLSRIAVDASITVLITEDGLSCSWSYSDVPAVLIHEASRALDRQANIEPDARNLADKPRLRDVYVRLNRRTEGCPDRKPFGRTSGLRRQLCHVRTRPCFPPACPAGLRRIDVRDLVRLLHGARLVLAPDGPPNLTELGKLIQSQGVTTAWLTAGLFNEIVEARPATLAGLREILTGGEALSPKHVLMAYRRLSQPLRIINGYGPQRARRLLAATPSTRPSSGPRTTSRSANRSAIPESMSSTATGNRSRSEWPAICISAETGSPAAI